MTTSWNLEHKSGTQRFTATFPEQTFPQELRSFVELVDASGSKLYARVAKRRGARGTQTWEPRAPRRLATRAYSLLPDASTSSTKDRNSWGKVCSGKVAVNRWVPDLCSRFQLVVISARPFVSNRRAH